MNADRLQPALFGGLLIGVLSALPFVNIGNCCCCLWVVAGGVLATYLRQQNTPYEVAASEGALVGMMAGAIGGIVAALLSIPMALVTGPMQDEFIQRLLSSNPDIPPELREAFERAAGGSGMRASRVLFMLVGVVIDTVFGMLGGLLGVALFKKKGPPPPVPGTIDVPPALPPQL